MGDGLPALESFTMDILRINPKTSKIILDIHEGYIGLALKDCTGLESL
jgi:hypothetical protein